MSDPSATTPVVTSFANEHVDVRSTKPFDRTVKDLTAELGRVSAGQLMDRLASSAGWDDFAAECADFAGRSNLIEVAALDWGRVMTLAGVPTRARCFVIGNPLTARKLIEAGGPEVGLYLPTRILVFEDAAGDVHVAYDRFGPVMAGRGEAAEKVAAVIDGVLASLAAAAAG